MSQAEWSYCRPVYFVISSYYRKRKAPIHIDNRPLLISRSIEDPRLFMLLPIISISKIWIWRLELKGRTAF